MPDMTPEQRTARLREALEAIGTSLDASRYAFRAFAGALMEAINAPGVRDALANGARAAAAECRGEAASKRLAADPDPRDNFLRILTKAAHNREAARLDRRADELDQAAAVLQPHPSADEAGDADGR